MGTISPPVNPQNLAFGDKELGTLCVASNSIFKVRLEIPFSVQY
jgi:hypothetical protein